ncbi:MAG: phosphoenolpyruvate synthase [Actinomycetales bacterium]|nr:phosphoenolpyruvate synthase [Actinomycetales bacterium]
MDVWTIRFDDPSIDRASAGGKAVNLGLLTQAGFPVPAGFVVTTDAYRRFVADRDLVQVIDEAMADADLLDPAGAEAASTTIRAAFRAGAIPEELAEAIAAAYADLGFGSVAVRSSATAEDLPHLSFAGQQDTFLGIIGPEQLHEAVRECWSSLWTTRAIAYRRANLVSDDAVALAVAVQRLVSADVSGVLFTANPLTGHRGQMTIDATFGLGEALVSGQVEPDHIVADSATGRVIDRTLGAKALATIASAAVEGGVITESRDAADQSALTDAQVAELVALGRRVQDTYATPQDIEWALGNGHLHLLQSRAITSLFPIPDGAPPESLWLSFGAVQGVLAPMTPLGRDVIKTLLSGAARLFGHDVDPRTTAYIGEAGERVWLRLDRILRNPLGHKSAPAFLRFVDPSAAAIVHDLLEEGGLASAPRSDLPRTARDVARFLRKTARGAAGAMLRPGQARDTFDATVEALVADAARREVAASAETDPVRRLAARGTWLRDALGGAFPRILPRAAPLVAPSVALLRVISKLTDASSAHGSSPSGHGISPEAMEITRAIPRNPTTEMDLALWEVAAAVAADAGATRMFTTLAPAELAANYAAGRLPRAAQTALAGFLAAYGMRGIGEIDLGRPRWREDPIDLIQTIQSYLALSDEQAPPAVFARGAASARIAVERLAATASGMPRGHLRARTVRFCASRVRALAGGREQPKFAVIQLMGVAREGLLASGGDLVAAGVLDHATDVFFLRLHELTELTPQALPALRELVSSRRASWLAEARRARVPRVLVGDGRAFHEGLSRSAALADLPAGAIVGSPVSPGVVEGPVRVVADPTSAGLTPGEILVCVGTDPAWTPLFLTAGGLVTEVGGMMTHGSVVAREYGIPAVVGVHEATTRLVTGSRIRLDGSAGTIVPLD